MTADWEAPRRNRKLAATVRYNASTQDWLFGGRRRGSNGGGSVVIREPDLASCTATDLQRAMRAAQANVGFTEDVLVSTTPEPYFNEEDSFVQPVRFNLHDGALAVEITYPVDDYDEDTEQARVLRALAPLLMRNRMHLVRAEPNPSVVEPPWLWEARLGFHARGRSLLDLYRAGQDAIKLLEATNGGDNLTRATTADLVRSGNAHLLIGQMEGHWLDVKSRHYDLSSAQGQIALAQAVTRFCNAEDGGLIVVGMNTKKLQHGEQIRSVCPVSADRKLLRRYEQTLETRVFPPPDNLGIEMINMETGALVLIDIPPQEEELKPFLVHGAIVDGRVEGAFISIVRRRGESSIPITAQAIHSTLAAGRALLRRGELGPPMASGASNPKSSPGAFRH